MLEIPAGKYQQDLKKIYRQFSAQELIYTQAKWMVYLKAAQTGIANNVSTAVQWDALQFDCLGVGISQNYGFVCPFRGLYFVIVYLQYIDTLADHTYETRLYRDANRRRTMARVRGEGQAKYVGDAAGTIIEGARGQELIAHGFHQDGTANPGIDGGWVAKSNMTVHLLSRVCPT